MPNSKEYNKNYYLNKVKTSTKQPVTKFCECCKKDVKYTYEQHIKSQKHKLNDELYNLKNALVSTEIFKSIDI